MSYYYWTVRCNLPDGKYLTCEVRTERSIEHIDAIQDFYHDITGGKMLLLGMSCTPSTSVPSISDAFRRHVLFMDVRSDKDRAGTRTAGEVNAGPGD